MLTAKNKDGKILSLGTGMCVSELKRLRNSEHFFCPQCNERVILKLGTKKIPHFAHLRWSSCSERYDRESQYHLHGKLHIYKWLTNQQLNPQLELFLPDINQRPDIYFTYLDKKYCIEFQSSLIPEEIFVKRTNQYHQSSIKPIWILGGNNIRRLSEHKVSLSSFDYLFLQISSCSFLHAYCPNTQKLITLKKIYPISIRNAFVQFSISSFENMEVDKFIFPKNNAHMNLKKWFQEINKLKMNMLIKCSANQRKFLYELYQKNLYIQLLPPVIGLPLRESIWIETSPLIWQTYLYIDILMKKKEGQTVSYQQVYLCFINRWKNRDIKMRTIPLGGEWQPSIVIKEYLNILGKLGWLERINNNDYLIKRPFKSSTNQEQQERMEAYCINQMILQK